MMWMPYLLMAIVKDLPVLREIWPVSIAGWFAFLVAVSAVLAAVARGVMKWGRDTDKWDRAANALEQLSIDVNSLLHLIRGVEGEGGLIERLGVVEVAVASLQEHHLANETLRQFYMNDLLERRRRGEPLRREVDHYLATVFPTANEG